MVLNFLLCNSFSSVEVSKLKEIISKECITFHHLLRLVTSRQRLMKGIEIILAVKVVKYTVEGRSGSVKVEVVELM